METRKIYKCFISSPGDCNKERETCQRVIEKVNSGLAKHLGLNFEPFMWEYDVLPDMGRNGQEIIDEYVKKSNYDIFIGIMKNRFGHQTKKAGSGTEHEFNDALDRKSNSQESLPKILFFFGKELVDPETFDKEQYEKVKQFKKRISGNGLYVDFDEFERFEDKLEEKLNLFISDLSPLENPKEKIKEVDLILRKLEEDLSDSLKTYNEKSPVWIEPIISSKRDIPINPTKNQENRVDINTIIQKPDNFIIKAPSEFGLTSLAHHIKLEAWKSGKVFLYIDSKTTKKHKVVKDIQNEVKQYFFKNTDAIDCIMLDSVCFDENGIMQMIKNVCDEFQNIPLLIFNTTDNNFFLKSDEDDKVQIKRQFISYYLLPLPQNELRKVVSSYINHKSLDGDVETTLMKISKDLEVLNLHRTVKNCLTILKACSKIGNEYNAVNRTKLLETILTAIFQDYEIPTYHDEKPDIKDCSFVLGYFCELLVKRNDFEFTDDFFMEKLSVFCKEHPIELDLKYLLNVLKANSIIGTKLPNNNFFRNSYWVFYFLAHRMNMDKDFREVVFENKKYIDYPEIIEFYTGIDRNREDALTVLNNDLSETLKFVRSKVQIPDSLNPFKSITWNPNINELEKQEALIGENVISSGLPDEVKDKYDDKLYDQRRPYYQVINSVMREYSFQVLNRNIKAASRALRNSDFVNNINLKNELLDNITKSWHEFNKLLIALSPMLADNGSIAFEGANFYLDEAFTKFTDPEEKRKAVLLALPSNIVKIFKDDLFSTKMGPLLINKAEKESNSLIKHELMILIVAERPKKWREVVDRYIVSLDKNSFFLSDMLFTINFNIDYKATEITDVQTLKLLAKKCRAKHILKNNNPDIGLITQLDKLEREGKIRYK